MDNKCFYPRVVSSRITPLKAKMDGVKENKMHRKPRNLAGMLEFLMINVQFNGEKHYIKQTQFRNITLCSKFEFIAIFQNLTDFAAFIDETKENIDARKTDV